MENTGENQMPDVTVRIKQLIDLKAQGNVSLFVEKTGIQSVQKLNRLFHLDKRNNKYPIPSTDLLIKIANAFPGTRWSWLMDGEGAMFLEKSLKTNDKDVMGSQSISSNSGYDENYPSLGAYNPDQFKPVRIIRHSVWVAYVDNFNEFNFKDLRETVPVYLPNITSTISEGHLAFEIFDDSMEPTLMEKAQVLAELVENEDFDYLNGGVYIIAYRNKLVARRIVDNDLLKNDTLTLHSDNSIRGSIVIKREDIRYIWHVTDIIGSKVK